MTNKNDFEFAVIEDDLKKEKLNTLNLEESHKVKNNIRDKNDAGDSNIAEKVEQLVENGKNALKEMIELDQDQVNHIIKEML
jgi:hypothetical protein